MLLLESDSEKRVVLIDALRKAGLPVSGASSIAEIERWPDDLVITDARCFTQWWKTVGARFIVVLASTPEEGAEACARGATLWLPRECSPEWLVSVVRSVLNEPPNSGESLH